MKIPVITPNEERNENVFSFRPSDGGTKGLTPFIAFVLTVCIAVPCAYSANIKRPAPPPEPAIDLEKPFSHPSVVDVDINKEQSFLYISYDLDGDGIIDYMTARRITNIRQNEYGNTVGTYHSIYPIFYWYDANHDGKFVPEDDEMWHDPEEDGLNGNEILYKNPPE